MFSKSHKDAGRRDKGVKTRVIFISPKEKLSKKHSKETGNFNTFVVNGMLVFFNNLDAKFTILELQVKFNRQDALVLQEIGGCCAESLKHVKNLYDQTRYLKGVINMVSYLLGCF